MHHLKYLNHQIRMYLSQLIEKNLLHHYPNHSLKEMLETINQLPRDYPHHQ